MVEGEREGGERKKGNLPRKWLSNKTTRGPRPEAIV